MPIVFRLLGPLALGSADRVTGLSVPKIRCMLAVLLLDADRVVSLDRLVDELWGDDPPRSAVANLRSYALALRRALAATGIDPERLVTTPGGYRLQVAPGECDLEVWESHAEAGVAALTAGRHQEAARQLDQALSCWRGAALDGIPVGPVLAARATALDELRTAHTEDLFEARLGSGEGIALVAPLREHIAAHPTRERAYEQLMRVLYAVGDTAAALTVYQQARDALAEGLGLEPGPQLREVQRAVLRRDPSLAPPAPAHAITPRQLPPDVPVLVGRQRELARLHEGTAVVRNVHGPGGVGKSALAIRLAHRLRDRYPDGQLYLDLQGSNPRLTPLDPVDVLGRFVRALGVPYGRLPQEPADVAALYRTLLAERRVLILLDNAVDAAQVRPLLPGVGDSLVLVTSRRALTALDGVAMLALDVLPEDAAAELLDRIAGPALRADGASALALAGLCGRLPLALRIAAARLAARPDWSAADLVERLVDERNRLDELHSDDMAVRSCFQASYRVLDPVAARAFRMAGLARVPELSVAALGALLDAPAPVAASALDRLVEARLVEVESGRFRLHDLLRLYAAEQSAALDGSDDRSAALRRLLVYYANTTRRAVGVLMGYQRPLHPALHAPPGEPPLTFATAEQAEAWLDAELPGAIVAAEQADEAGDDGRRYPAQLIRVGNPYLSRRHGSSVPRLADTALRLRPPDDHASEAIASSSLGQHLARSGRFDEAHVVLTRALELWQRVGDLDGIATICNGLGSRANFMGNGAEALHYYQLSLDALRRLGNRDLQQIVLNNMSEVHCSERRFAEGIACVRESLRINHTGNRALFLQLSALAPLAVLQSQLGDLRSALRIYHRAMEVAEKLDDVRYLIELLLCRSEAYLRVRRVDLARTDVDQAARHTHRVSDNYWPACVQRQLGRIHLATGDLPRAARHRAEAEILFRQTWYRSDRFMELYLAGDDPALPHPP
ncbi:AfsR/SARP family transcriptional regulator [Catellatospora citrea]|uniref:SARP family transcriptional regulator n=1 Tax=Catellatospora citrea TaxID=53366 RepID=A0A8J3NXL5_9ACTN|nr:BTAD domain-containing putative transcriptional regulator [Catellatospora citrea]RKE10991.1 DNA-binding SARP family transcriptional activator [Catellatospora citrea]GIF96447.1 SARP family transcriptional regulator [Catellatospora citrea]